MGWSDMPNILDNNKVLINLAAYDIPVPFTLKKITTIRNPARNDMVIFRARESLGDKLIVKRVVGIPGDLIEIRNHKLLLNGKQLKYIFQFDEDHSFIPNDQMEGKTIVIEEGNEYNRIIAINETNDKTANYDSFLITEDQYFVLGDNRSLSQDSRHFGTISRKDILGKVIKVFGKK